MHNKDLNLNLIIKMENKRNILESEVDLKDIIVIDIGTETIKMGYSGENRPRVNIWFRL